MNTRSGYTVDRSSGRVEVKTAFANPASSGNNAFVAAVSGKKIRVIAYRLQAGGTVNVKFTDTDGTDISQTWEFQAREGCAVSALEFSFEFESAVGKGVQVNLSAAIQAHVSIQYMEVL